MKHCWVGEGKDGAGSPKQSADSGGVVWARKAQKVRQHTGLRRREGGGRREVPCFDGPNWWPERVPEPTGGGASETAGGEREEFGSITLCFEMRNCRSSSRVRKAWKTWKEVNA